MAEGSPICRNVIEDHFTGDVNGVHGRDSNFVDWVERKPTTRKPSAGICRRALLAALVAGCAPPTASTVFREAVTERMPPSLAILNYHAPRDLSLFEPPTYWVHFTINRDELKNMISTDGFIKEPGRPSLKFDHLNPPQWWTPGDLGEDPRAYRREELPLDLENSNWSKIMLVNGDMTEVYCFKLVYW